MAWEIRGNRRYFYRKVKRDGKVRSIYVGSEAVAGSLVHEAAERQRMEEYRRREFRKFLTTADAVGYSLAAAGQQIDILLSAKLLSAGLHRSGNGLWRYPREKRKKA